MRQEYSLASQRPDPSGRRRAGKHRPEAGGTIRFGLMTIRGARRDAELVLVNGRIRTPGHPSGFTAAMAIGGGFILAIGSDDEIRELTGPHTRVVNLRGRLAIPA